MVKRVLVGIIIFLSGVLLPFWVTALFALVASFYFKWYFEMVCIAIFMDMIYAPGSTSGVYSTSISTGSLILLIFIEYLKTKIRFYNAQSF